MSRSAAGKAYLICGGASLIGSHLADQLLAAGAGEVRLLDNYSLGTPEIIAHLDGDTRVKRIRGDILRLNELIEAAQGVDGIFALAGFLTLPMSQNPPLGVAVNTEGMVNILEAARLAKVRHVVFSSSVAAYGNTAADTLAEDSPTTMASVSPVAAVYGTTKLLGEQLGRLYAQKYGVGFSGMRFSSVYGERQHARAVNANFIADVHDQIRRGERPVIVGDGREVHDYIYVTDVAAGCIAAMLNGEGGQVFNLCTGVDTTHADLVRTILEVCGSEMQPEYREDTRAVRSAGGNHLGFSPTKAEREIGWKPAVSLRDGVARMVAWREKQRG
ncbi:MAG: NAD-dependent epimerase/dehydratase family protein [Rubritepida sp.]|nr:NAD-dependent epimerase/dehydratase family protein [Rubritepida sp.]